MTGGEQEADRLARLAAAVNTLPMKLRAVWLLGTVDHFNYERIGFRLGLSVAEAERCTARAMLRIHRRVCGRPDWLGRWR